MKRAILLSGMAVALGCGGDTAATSKPSTTTPSAVEAASQKPKLRDTAKQAPAIVDEPPPPSAVKKKEEGAKKDEGEPKAPPPVDKPGLKPTSAAPSSSGSG